MAESKDFRHVLGRRPCYLFAESVSIYFVIRFYVTVVVEVACSY